MPANVKTVLHKANQLIESLPTTKPLDPKLVDCISRIWLEFPSGVKKVRASDMEHLEARFTAPTIIAAKKILLVKSVREKDGWYWTRPRWTVRTAIEKASNTPFSRERKLVNRKLQRGSVTTLQRIMRDNGYVMNNQAAMNLMEVQELYSHCSVLLAKSIIGIPTIKRDGVCVWVWPAAEVKNWLLEKLADGPLTPAELNRLAEEEMNWEPILLTVAKQALPQIHIITSDTTRVVRWADSTVMARQKSGRVIMVDFEEEPEPEEAPLNRTTQVINGVLQSQHFFEDDDSVE